MNESEATQCDDEDGHDWVYKEDWEGDPGVIGGTNTLRWLECTICGAQKEASYEDAPTDEDFGGY